MKIKSIILDRSKCEKVDIQEEKHLNFILKKEKKKLGKLLNPCMKKVVLLKVNL